MARTKTVFAVDAGALIAVGTSASPAGIPVGGGGGGGGAVTGADCTGSGTAWTIPGSFSTVVAVFVDGQQMDPASDYTIIGAAITLAVAALDSVFAIVQA